jgi:pimeloyl-ACP methyl ester carboxylesterase
MARMVLAGRRADCLAVIRVAALGTAHQALQQVFRSAQTEPSTTPVLGRRFHHQLAVWRARTLVELKSVAGYLNTRQHVILVHGAANSSAVWRFWREELALRGWTTHAVDLRGHGAGLSVDLSTVTMRDYADDVAQVADQLSPKPLLIGWSMGGLVAMMVAARNLASACVALAPSSPAVEVDPSVSLRTGVFDSREYGITSGDPMEQPAMPDLDLEERQTALNSLGLESRLARDERKRGIVIGHLPCPLLVITGELDTDWPRERYAGLHFPAEFLAIEDCSHWGLVLNRRALSRLVPLVSDWISRAGS